MAHSITFILPGLWELRNLDSIRLAGIPLWQAKYQPGCSFQSRAQILSPKSNGEREIEPVGDLPIAPAGAVDGHLAIDPVPRKDNHAADLNSPVMRFIEPQLENVGTTESLHKKNSPSSEL